MSTSTAEQAALALRRAVAREAARPAHPAVHRLVDALARRFGEELVGVLYYGSCRRRSEPEGLVDLHVVVEDERRALGGVAGRLCRLLPPNVYYLEVDDPQVPGRRVRCKFAVLGRAAYRRRCSAAAFHSYFWARYAQPVTLLGVADDARARDLEDGLVASVRTLFARALPRIEATDDPLELWVRALSLCYRAELRVEGVGRARQLVEGQAEYFRATGDAVLALAPQLERRRGLSPRLDWALRGVWGKVLSLARLLKALYTFDGGLDYIAWKLERHSGRPVEIPARVRRRPLVHLWPLIWRLWREGVFR